MSTNAISEEKQRQTEGEPPARELAPSILREDEPSAVRLLGMFGLVFALVGADLLLWAVFHRSALHGLYGLLARAGGKTAPEGLGTLGTLMGTVFFAGGLVAMLLHSALEKEAQLRRVYGLFGVVWLVLGVLGILFQMAHVAWAANLFLPGVAAVTLGLLFVLAFVHNEPATDWREMAVGGVGILGGVMALVGFLGGNIFAAFLLPEGFVLLLLGLAFLSAFLVARGSDDDLAYRVGLGVGGLGALVFLVALVRSIAQASAGYFVPNGVVLGGMGLLYVLVYVLLFVDNPVVVMARRELAAFFYSPIAYLVLLGFTFVGWLCLWQFLVQALPQEGLEPLFEPIVRVFFFGLVPVVAVIFIVPVLTMRLLSEERRTGTLEVLLTGPVSEWSVVLSKFLAALAFFLILWVPWALFLVALRIQVGQPFDIRPLLCFLVALLFTGANFVGMGLFFSCVTRNQIIAAVLTFAGMFGLLFIFIAVRQANPAEPSSAYWVPILTHMSFPHLWFDSLDGKLDPAFLLYHLSAAVFWVFLTVKVLEARRWS
ncbi:MAG TPA: ABC transporter permease [Gemmataceae bacterium]|nr:ABC transporter permease [Gemmataceae bacterium]